MYAAHESDGVMGWSGWDGMERASGEGQWVEQMRRRPQSADGANEAVGG